MREKVIDWLKNNVSEHRLQHILGVEKMCEQLAIYHKIDPEKAAKAGLMHDLAKFFPPPKLLAMAKKENNEIDEICLLNPHLLHADASAIIARETFGVKDEDILNAIRNHTLGKPEMSHLSCIVFIADALEPNRGNNSELEKMRKVSSTNLYKSVQQTCEYSLQYLIKHNKTIHPRAILTRNWALHKVRAKH
ncbi:bis(5'-nucleosyl)-tetraphosphatase (symmetrical) YqeK [Crocosphaera sp.]|uniref:bis(5'-nucleosyl)-tetraphosphatase (symmetrical) YqeK n=1 Tax=Crocosphaera sp. TaxID=2729996 RepID=UPI00262C617D|nr:bis(5'-nucleosyl)-tetraphosphatase (symmetrical) YqeK [Crocosphaera sp.]MDJ0578756.1 bis(5'-nucleosyl)-tetraphosphatase (symmetrical) YqeK [Crocosphaera sp.]